MTKGRASFPAHPELYVWMTYAQLALGWRWGLDQLGCCALLPLPLRPDILYALCGILIPPLIFVHLS